jgi:hypothetical protein
MDLVWRSESFLPRSRRRLPWRHLGLVPRETARRDLGPGSLPRPSLYTPRLPRRWPPAWNARLFLYEAGNLHHLISQFRKPRIVAQYGELEMEQQEVEPLGLFLLGFHVGGKTRHLRCRVVEIIFLKNPPSSSFGVPFDEFSLRSYHEIVDVHGGHDAMEQRRRVEAKFACWLGSRLWRGLVVQLGDQFDLRHSWTSLQLVGGMPVERLAAMGGWSSVAMLYEVYGHIIPADFGDGATVMDRALEKARSER